MSLHSSHQIPDERPEVTFKVAAEDDVFKSQTWKNWSVKVLGDVLSWIFFPVGIFRLCTTYFGFVTASLHSMEKVERYRSISSGQLPRGDYALNRVVIRTADGVALDTIAIENGAQDKKQDQKWILYFNGNGACWEKTLPDQVQLALKTGAHVYTGNYRGVGHSEGLALSSQDLLLDGEAMVQYLIKAKGVKPENILLYGWSLGAVVATDLAALHPEMAHCNDRSFGSTYLQVKAIVAGVFGSFLGSVVAKVTCAVGWTFNTAESYVRAGKRKFIVFCHKDSIVPYEASAYREVKRKQMSADDWRRKKERLQVNKSKIVQYPTDYKPECIRLRRGKVKVVEVPGSTRQGSYSFFNFVSWAFLKIRGWYVGQDMVGYHTHIAPLTGSRKYTWERDIFDAFCDKVRTILDLPAGEEL